MNQVALENFKIDKTKWNKVKLGDVVYEPKETVKDPVKEGIQHVVGLEHIDSEDIHLRRSASIDESTTFTKKFRKGDVLFGRRRAYLKKAAIAAFDGICSGDITVMRAKNDLLAELLPFIINNDKFFDYAVTHSAGGLSPRVKFKDIANFSLGLPTLEDQVNIKDLLGAADYAIQKNIYLKEKLLQQNAVILDSIFTYKKNNNLDGYISTDIGFVPESWEVVEQGKVVEFVNGRAFHISEWEKAGTPVIRLQNLTGSGEKYYYSNLDLPEKNYCIEGDLLYMWSATFGAKIWHGEKAIFHYHIWKIVCDERKVLKKYMYYNLEEITRRMMKQVSGSTMPHITKAGMEKLKIALPPIEQQKVFVQKLDQLASSIEYLNISISNLKRLSNSLVNQIF